MNIVEYCNGLPFIDEAFDTQRLLAAVGVVRATHARRHGIEATESECLAPDLAREIRRQDIDHSISSSPVAVDEIRQIESVIDTVAAEIPAWVPLVRIPVVFRKLQDTRAISASSFAWPQTVFLSDAAFESNYQLAEQICHELSHCWMYFLEEIRPFRAENYTRTHALPSGTTNRDAVEILEALHVALALRTLWQQIPDYWADEESRRRRREELSAYADGCLQMIPRLRDEYSTQGQLVADVLVDRATGLDLEVS